MERAKKVLLQSEKQGQKKYFAAAQNRRARDFIGADSLPPQFVGDQRAGDSR